MTISDSIISFKDNNRYYVATNYSPAILTINENFKNSAEEYCDILYISVFLCFLAVSNEML